MSVRRYVMVVYVDESVLDGDDSIENARRVVNDKLDPDVMQVQPLSEVIAS